MALVSKLPPSDPIPVPAEPEHWVRFRPLKGGDMKGISITPGGEVEIASDLIAACIVEWSYEDPPSVESIDDQDLDTYLWLTQQIKTLSNIREEQEKKASNGSSSPPSRRVRRGSPQSLSSI